MIKRNMLVGSLSTLLLAGQVQAASILPATFAADVGEVSTDITTVGGAIIGLAVVALGVRWVKATFFG